jgi:DNA primase
VSGLILTAEQLAHARPIVGEGGHALRGFCPFHGSDNQRSLRVEVKTGRFKCFACQAWGYTDEARENWLKERAVGQRAVRTPEAVRRKRTIGSPNLEPKPVRDDLDVVLQTYRAALPTSPGEEYLRRRGIPVELALRHGLGYAPPGQWAHQARDWREGRIIAPHTDPSGRVLNLYGRAVELRSQAPKWLRHDHLPAAEGRAAVKAVFNAPVLKSARVFIAEGAFDALSLLTLGFPSAAIFGVDGWRWQWVEAMQIVLALDNDHAGQAAFKQLALQASLRGKQVYYLSRNALGGCKDINEAFVKGVLDTTVLIDKADVDEKRKGAEEEASRL